MFEKYILDFEMPLIANYKFSNYEIKDPPSRTRIQTIAQGIKKNIYIPNGAMKSYLHNLLDYDNCHIPDPIYRV